MNVRPPRMVPPGYFLLSVALIFALHHLVPVVQWPGRGWRWLAWIPLVPGLVLFVFTVAYFHRTHTPLRPLEDKGTLMTGGAFRLSRNPIYLGMTLMLTALCLYLGSPLTLLVPPAFATAIQRTFIVREEAFLTAHFGDAYRSYQRRVRRWL